MPCPTYPKLGATSQPHAVTPGNPTQEKTGKLLSAGTQVAKRVYIAATAKVRSRALHAFSNSVLCGCSPAQKTSQIQDHVI